MLANPKWVLLGYGEVAQMLVTEALLVKSQTDFTVYLAKPSPSDATLQRLAASGITPTHEPTCVAGANVVISAVTSGSALAVAAAVAPFLSQGTIFVDLNSTTKTTILQVAQLMEERGAQLVDASIMAPVPLHGRAVPIVLSGPGALRFHQLAQTLNLNTSILSDSIGDASNLKMLWSVFTKGFIALLAEGLVPAQRLGLLEPMLTLLGQFGYYGSDEMIVRMLVSSVRSGDRRIEEMLGVRQTVEAVGIAPRATCATIEWLSDLSELDYMPLAGGGRGVVMGLSNQLTGVSGGVSVGVREEPR